MQGLCVALDHRGLDVGNGHYGHEVTARLALLDHELCHIDTIDVPEKQLKELRGDDPNAVSWKTDDIGRPRLRSVPGNWNTGDGFTQVVARHGVHAIEYRNIAHAKASADAARIAGDADRVGEAAA